ncbi:MAG TPA: PIN domain-containing protein [Chitinophagales bacterium]|nr:PIN domain-containing protein [Chitinophagales bacterium]
MSKIFADTDVCIDLLSSRKPFNAAAEKLFSLADTGKMEICVSSLSFVNIDYVLRSQYSNHSSRQIFAKFKTLVHVLPVDSRTIDLAIAADFNDFEDAIQYFVAIENGITVLVTRNIKDFKNATIKVVTPEIYLATTY